MRNSLLKREVGRIAGTIAASSEGAAPERNRDHRHGACHAAGEFVLKEFARVSGEALRAPASGRPPISTNLHQKKCVTDCIVWCPGEDSNLHELLHWYLKPARLPVPPPGQDECRKRGAEMYALTLSLSNERLQ